MSLVGVAGGRGQSEASMRWRIESQMEEFGIQTSCEGHLTRRRQLVNPRSTCMPRGNYRIITRVMTDGWVEGEKCFIVRTACISSGPRSHRACTAMATRLGSHDIM